MTSIPPILITIAFLAAVVSVCAATFVWSGSILASSFAGFFAVAVGVVIGWVPSWALGVCLLLSLLSIVGRVLTSRFEEGGSDEEKVVKFSLFGIPLVKK